jgi:hypothetical protein
MPKILHIVTTCTDRKRAPVPHDRKLREARNAPVRVRAKAWWQRLSRSREPFPVSARDLYAGEHWCTALRLPTVPPLRRATVNPWVASAGYGLVGWDTPLKPYSATFAAGVADSVLVGLPEGTSRGPFLQAWWDAISAFSGPVSGAPRRVAELARRDPDSTILVVAPPDYVRAMEGDLLVARSLLARPGRLVIVSNRAKLAHGPLAANLVPVDQRARAVVGGTMQGLNARVALELLRRLGKARLEAGKLQALYQAMTQDASTPTRPKGEPMTDDQVIVFIREQVAADPKAKQTRLLRKLRDSGRSCEQARFRGLFQRVTKSS